VPLAEDLVSLHREAERQEIYFPGASHARRLQIRVTAGQISEVREGVLEDFANWISPTGVMQPLRVSTHITGHSEVLMFLSSLSSLSFAISGAPHYLVVYFQPRERCER
jgi:hypothetical protein